MNLVTFRVSLLYVHKEFVHMYMKWIYCQQLLWCWLRLGHIPPRALAPPHPHALGPPSLHANFTSLKLVFGLFRTWPPKLLTSKFVPPPKGGPPSLTFNHGPGKCPGGRYDRFQPWTSGLPTTNEHHCRHHHHHHKRLTENLRLQVVGKLGQRARTPKLENPGLSFCVQRGGKKAIFGSRNNMSLRRGGFIIW